MHFSNAALRDGVHVNFRVYFFLPETVSSGNTATVSLSVFLSVLSMEEMKMESFESNSTFEETVLCTRDQLSVLPDNILNVLSEYQEGKLPPVSKEDVIKLLSNWFNNKHGQTSEYECSTDNAHVRLEVGNECKRQRFDCDV